MSDVIKHECGIAMIHLKKDLHYFKEKYGTAMYGINKMYLMMEKQHNRGQDGAGLACVSFFAYLFRFGIGLLWPFWGVFWGRQRLHKPQ